MRSCRVHHIDAFSTVPHKGNPAGVVVETDDLDDKAMQSIAAAVGFNETVFVLPSSVADHRFRFFTPGHEMPLCGHATIAAAFFLGKQAGQTQTLMIETVAGTLPVGYDDATGLVTMRHAKPRFQTFTGPLRGLADVLGIDESGIETAYPVAYGSTGAWTLLVPVCDEATLFRMKPKNRDFPNVMPEIPRTSIHPFVIADGTGGRDFVARHFSSPFSGTIEDPVTGTASGVMGAYAMRHLYPDAERKRFVVAQGAGVGRDGTVFVDAVRQGDDIAISIAGQTVEVDIMTMRFD